LQVGIGLTVLSNLMLRGDYLENKHTAHEQRKEKKTENRVLYLSLHAAHAVSSYDLAGTPRAASIYAYPVQAVPPEVTPHDSIP
jgi:predicted NodU family carbamoyl transferase